MRKFSSQHPWGNKAPLSERSGSEYDEQAWLLNTDSKYEFRGPSIN